MIAAALGVLFLVISADAIQPAPSPDCAEWHDCRQLALAAADRGDYTAFHDLAWRAVQTGPPRNPALMYLLARAQALSGRPHDALVMLDRLAGMGVASDALTNDDFARTRQLPDWPDVAARIERLVNPSPAPPAETVSPAAIVAPVVPVVPVAPTTAAPVTPKATLPAPTPAATAPAAAFTPLPVVEAVRFSTGQFLPAGLAYDAVSRRFLFGDRLGHKLIVVGESANHADDLVRSDSAGFQEISAMHVDTRRGDIWVASTAAAGGSASVHKLQLVSGRPLKAFPVSADLEPVQLVDLTATPSGSVVVLDSIGSRVLVLRPGDTALKTSVQFDANEPTSVTAAGDDSVAYVAHSAGILRIDLHSRAVSVVRVPKRVALGHLERIRWHRQALIAVDVDADGSRRILRLELNAAGRAVTRATTLEALTAPSGETFVTVSGDELLYISATPSSSAAEVVTYRVRLPFPRP